MSTKTAFYIVGAGALALALFYAFKSHAATVANDSGLTAASPPPQPVGGSHILTSREASGLGAYAPSGRMQFFR